MLSSPYSLRAFRRSTAPQGKPKNNVADPDTLISVLTSFSGSDSLVRMRQKPRVSETALAHSARQVGGKIDVPEPPRAGDKVRIKTGPHLGARGVIRSIQGDRATVKLETGARSSIRLRELTNYSAAARLAWKRMPKRAGRPPSPHQKT